MEESWFVGRYKFDLATRDDDAELRAILAATPMDGDIAVSFRREPSFLDAAAVEGDFHQVMVCRDLRAKRVAGFGCRSIRSRYVNGQPTAIGYLSGLRALPEYRSRGLVARAYAMFHELHSDGRTPLYLTTIAEGNERALSTLTKARAGLPVYHFSGRYHTVVIPIGRRRHLRRGDFREAGKSIDVRSASQEDLAEVLGFLNTVGPSRQFFPCYDENDLFGEHCTLRDLAPADLLLAYRGDQLVGTLGGWDQHAFKQSVVEGYQSHLRWTRPLYNAWARLRELPKLPRPGSSFRYLTAALPVVLNDDPGVVSALLEFLLQRAASGPCEFLVVGLHESDPLLPLFQPLQSACYLTRTYVVCWDDGEPLRAQFDDRPMYLELGCL